MTKMTININKDVLKKSMFCSTAPQDVDISQNCAVAIAIRDLFPNACIGTEHIYLNKGNYIGSSIELPREASNFIKKFDELRFSPKKDLNYQNFLLILKFLIELLMK